MSSSAAARKKPPSPRSRARAAGSCCAEEAQSGAHATAHPDHTEYLPRLNRVRGQIAGIEKMIAERRYCVDILVQFRAAMAALRSVEVAIFETHLQHCVSQALLSRDKKETETKIRELSELLSRRTSL